MMEECSAGEKTPWIKPSTERGAALIVVLVMLLLLSILGMTMLASTTTDLQIAGNFRTTQKAFYGAEAALEQAQVDESVYLTIIPDDKNADRYPAEAGKDVSIKDDEIQASYNVRSGGFGPPPPGYGEDFRSVLYVITATGSGPNGAQVQLESEIARVVPNQ